MMLLSSDTQQHPPADARQKPGHQVRPSGDTITIEEFIKKVNANSENTLQN